MLKMSKDIRHCASLYGGKYYASKDGRIFLDKEGVKPVHAYVTKNGHLRTTTHPLALIARIVWYAFHNTDPVKGYDVHHISEDKTDNRLENLVLLSHADHVSLHRTGKLSPMYGRTGENNPASKRVKCIDPVTFECLAEFSSTREASYITGVNQGNISSCCNHRQGHSVAGGYIWEFA